MSENCPNSMEENKGESEENSKPHFTKVIDYAPKETWRTDVLIGQKRF